MKLKKYLALCLCAAALLLALTGCGSKEPVTTFAQGTAINGLDVSGMTPAQAEERLAQPLEDYQFTLTLGDESYTKTASELAMGLDPDVDCQGMLDEQNESGTLTFSVEKLYTAQMSALAKTIALSQDIMEGDGAPQNARLAYDAASQRYVIVPEQIGQRVDAGAVAADCLEAVLALERELTLDMEDYGQAPTLTADSPEVLAALDAANARLALDLTYTFTPQGESTSELTLSRSLLARLYCLDSETGLTLSVDEEALGSFVDELAEQYDGANKSRPFVTSHGYEISIRVTQAGQSVDSAGLYDDLLTCLTEGTGGVRKAPYAAASDDDSYWGGDYVEVDLTSQQLWVYNDGVCVLNCPVVSGCVYNGTTTTTGVFQIFDKNKDRYLNGYNVDGTKYRSWVNYFMPFNGGIGFHDASWRSSFGGTEYYYNGSHGCVGVSVKNAGIIYDNVRIGTHVVVYGGISRDELPGRTQKITLSVPDSVLHVGDNTCISVTGGKTAPTFASDNPAVATVDESGNVAAISPGTAVITVTCPAKNGYAEAVQMVTITVEEPVHTHDWVEIVDTVEHPAVTEEITVVDVEGWTEQVHKCSVCAAGLTAPEQLQEHIAASSGCGEAVVVTETIEHPAQTHTETRVVTEAWTETVLTVVCVGCGEEQSETE